MVDVFFSKKFAAALAAIRDELTKARIKKQIEKIRQDPRTGKPMSYQRKGTRELRIKPYRLSYAYLPALDQVVILDLYHKKKQ